MIIRNVELETVCGITSRLPENERWEVAFAGKSNVGKSSLINALINRKSLARTSAQPGKTQTINFYRVDALDRVRPGKDAGRDQAEVKTAVAEGITGQTADSMPAGQAPDRAQAEKDSVIDTIYDLYLVDLPGYGYARANEEVKAQWGKLIERYLRSSKRLKAVFLLIDIRHEPGENDRLMYDWICGNGYQPVIIATKLDKIKRSQTQKQLCLIRRGLQVKPGSVLIPFSAQTKQGRDEIWNYIADIAGNEES